MISLSVRGVRGGVGNSSLLAALGHALHHLGQSVLLVDMCPENLLGLHFNLSVGERGGWARALLDEQNWEDQAWTLQPQLCLLPYGQLDHPEQQQVEHRLSKDPDVWARRQAALAKHFDWMLFDLPQRLPGHAEVGSCALQIQVAEADAACHVLLHRAEALDGYLLVNRFEPASLLQRDMLLIWRRLFGARMLPLAVHNDEAMREALALQKPLGQHSPASLAAQDVLSLATWCLAQRQERP
ncbi:cellulose synthase operon protein YhjQ [Pseudomonas sp. FFUP_PS_473]|uniref:cellulose biosynthesis protein BcsQ n=1 Tax=Pseudomonas sp. FFUP_PS_473 TaxID=2060418 RepID=UPI000C7AA831|nr:cellulose biosynthesis protein BcsQ [Pseudomonas sp. FFUP_PS_473]PLP88029.1 cellulose synthase operon protein YhjQ [Pseudomonas sp. FFUP_PS_473]